MKFNELNVDLLLNKTLYMKGTTKLLIVLLAAFSLTATSCKKKKDDSVKARLTGKWKLMQTGMDANNNSIMEPSEVVSIPDSLALFTTYQSDGTGSLSFEFMGASISSGFTWSLLNNEADVSVKANGSANPIFSVSEGTFHIHSLTSADLITRDSTTIDSVSGYAWNVFKKQ
jgi:hypothetical protein